MERHTKPRDPSDELAFLLAKFREHILKDDVAFAVITARLTKIDNSNINSDLPDFTLEPTLERTAEGSNLGFRIGHGRHKSIDEGTVGVTFYDYLGIGQLDMEAGHLEVDPGLEALLANNGLEKSDAIRIAISWQEGIGILQQMGDQLAFDPRTHTVALVDEIDRTIDFGPGNEYSF